MPCSSPATAAAARARCCVRSRAHRQRRDPSSAHRRLLLPAPAALPAGRHLRSQLIYPSAHSDLGEQQRLAFGRVLVHQPGIVILDEAASALDSGNEASLYGRLRKNGATLISIAHRAGVLRHHTHVLHLMGESAWEVHGAKGYEFDGPVATVHSNGNDPEPARQAPALAPAGQAGTKRRRRHQ